MGQREIREAGGGVKIIKPGNPDAPRLRRLKVFTCQECGCVFEADPGEYSAEQQYNDVDYYARCPCCGETTYRWKPYDGRE